MNLKASVEDLNAMLLQGRIQEAWNTYYADDVVRRAGQDTPLVGMKLNLEHDKDFVISVTEWGSSAIKAVAVDEDKAVTMVEWSLEFTHKVWGHIRQNQVCVQRWRDGRIYDESIYIMQIKDRSHRPMSRIEPNTGPTWRHVAAVVDGNDLPVERATLVTAVGDAFTVTQNGIDVMKGTSRVVSQGTPGQQDVLVESGPNAGKTLRQIIKIEGDVMVVCDGPPDGERPTEFTSEPGSGRTLSVWLRVKPGEVS
jgi:uncharacterized protein (TIGR03067 family)